MNGSRALRLRKRAYEASGARREVLRRLRDMSARGGIFSPSSGWVYSNSRPTVMDPQACC
jgi:hypothetical protein